MSRALVATNPGPNLSGMDFVAQVASPVWQSVGVPFSKTVDVAGWVCRAFGRHQMLIIRPGSRSGNSLPKMRLSSSFRLAATHGCSKGQELIHPLKHTFSVSFGRSSSISPRNVGLDRPWYSLRRPLASERYPVPNLRWKVEAL